MRISRRTFLRLALLLHLPTAAKAITQRQSLFVNGHIDSAGTHFISGFHASGHETFRQPLPDKAHGFAVDPNKPNRVIALPTLPGTRAVALNILNGKQLAVIESRPGRHFYGHACFSPDGRFLFTSENIIASAEGIITVRDGRDFRFLRELPGHGIGPHDIRMLPDGVTLVVAGGGLRTYPDSGKRELNINTMQSALLFIDSHSGKLLARREAPNAQLSIRHLDVGQNGEVLVACQYKGKKQMPKLVGLQHGEGEIEMLDIDDDHLWGLRNYTASARIASNGIAAITCPRGNQLTFWDLHKKRFIKAIEIQDVGGIEVAAEGNSFIVSANVGELYWIDAKSLEAKRMKGNWQNAKWTNHMGRSFV